VASLFMKSDVEAVLTACTKVEAFCQDALTREPAPPAGSEAAEQLARCQALAVHYAAQLATVLGFWTGPYPPVQPSKFWAALTVTRAVRDALPALQSAAAAADAAWSKESGRTRTARPKPEPGTLEQLGRTAKLVMVAIGVAVVGLVVVRLVT